jgi:hypothetical protein
MPSGLGVARVLPGFIDKLRDSRCWTIGKATVVQQRQW